MQVSTIVMLFLHEETEDGEVKNLVQDSTVMAGRTGVQVLDRLHPEALLFTTVIKWQPVTYVYLLPLLCFPSHFTNWLIILHIVM